MADNTLLKTVAIILAAGIVITGIIAALNYPSSDESRSVSVSGEATRIVSPDEVEIRFSIVTEEDTAELAGSENARIAEAVVAAIEGYGKVETQNYNVNPVRDYGYVVIDDTRERDLKIQFYRASNTVLLTTTNVENVGSAIDDALGAGANDVSGLYFQLSDELRSDIRTELLSEAGANAKEKAEAMAKGLGLSVGSVKTVSEGNVYFPSPRYFAMDAVMEDAGYGAKTPIQASDIEVTASLSVSYEIR